MLADQPYVSNAIKNAVAKLSTQSWDLRTRFGEYGRELQQQASTESQQIHFASGMYKIESEMFRVQQENDIGISKGIMAHLSTEMVTAISGQYVFDYVNANLFKDRVSALQYACYIQKRYRYGNDTEKKEYVEHLNDLIKNDSIARLDNNPQTFICNIARIIKILFEKIKDILPETCKFGEEIVDQIAEISSFDGGTAEIATHHYDINLPKKKTSRVFDMEKFIKKNIERAPSMLQKVI